LSAPEKAPTINDLLRYTDTTTTFSRQGKANLILFSCPYTLPNLYANAAALASPPPPSYEAISSSLPVKHHVAISNALHPRVAVLLGVNAKWHIPLLICRALSTAPAVWWGLRCALTFLGELLLSDGDGKGAWEHAWSVEKRFRVTEVFLAILWVRWVLKHDGPD
jgi:hypothetical protein